MKFKKIVKLIANNCFSKEKKKKLFFQRNLFLKLKYREFVDWSVVFFHHMYCLKWHKILGLVMSMSKFIIYYGLMKYHMLY